MPTQLSVSRAAKRLQSGPAIVAALNAPATRYSEDDILARLSAGSRLTMVVIASRHHQPVEMQYERRINRTLGRVRIYPAVGRRRRLGPASGNGASRG